jgi:hypothetical protein
MEDAAGRVVRFLYDRLVSAEERACVLVRAYVTAPVGLLDENLRDFAVDVAGHPLAPEVKALTLLATAGERPEWNSRHSSRGHRAIPLPEPEAVERAPMVAQLVRQLGLDVQLLLEPDPLVIMDLQQRTFNVFYVPEAVGSPYIPAQEDFVHPYGVRSVLGFGAVLPDGELFTVILFARVPIPRETAERFRPLALASKLAVLPFVSDRVFNDADD